MIDKCWGFKGRSQTDKMDLFNQILMSFCKINQMQHCLTLLAIQTLSRTWNISCKLSATHIHFHLGHLADAFVQCDLHYVHLSQERSHNNIGMNTRMVDHLLFRICCHILLRVDKVTRRCPGWALSGVWVGMQDNIHTPSVPTDKGFKMKYKLTPEMKMFGDMTGQ